MKKYFGFYDIILITALAVIPLSMLCFRVISVRTAESPVIAVYLDGELYGRYDPDIAATVRIGDTNTLRISDGKAFMLAADCPDQICVHSAPIDKNYPGSIVCLPNRVVVVMEDFSDSMDIDGYVS